MDQIVSFLNIRDSSQMCTIKERWFKSSLGQLFRDQNTIQKNVYFTSILYCTNFLSHFTVYTATSIWYKFLPSAYCCFYPVESRVARYFTWAFGAAIYNTAGGRPGLRVTWEAGMGGGIRGMVGVCRVVLYSETACKAILCSMNNKVLNK